ncbi:MAG: O-antigen ligase family protein [bacterium]|nr:O-antigen ligase family protein [bacterium]
MMRWIERLLILFIFLIPWQARFILRAGELGDSFWEYGTVALYATDVLFVVILLLSGIWWIKNQKSKIKNQNDNAELKNNLQLTTYNLLLITGYIAFSIFWSFDKTVSFYAALKFLEGVALFFIVRTVQSYEVGPHKMGGPTSRILWAFVASAVAQSVLAIAQFFTQSVFAWPFSGIAPQDPSDLGVSVVQFADERWLRAYGSFPHPNLLGAFIAIAAIILFTQLFRSRDEESGIKNHELGTLKFILHNSYFIILITGLFFTFSRTAWIAFFVGLVIYAIQTKAWREKIFLQLTLLLVVTGTILTVLFFPLVRTRVGGGSRLEIQSNQERTTGYREAMQLIKKHPFVGVGIGNYTVAVARELRLHDPVWSYQPAHNVFLLILSELGIFGLALFLIFFWRLKNLQLTTYYYHLSSSPSSITLFGCFIRVYFFYG